MMSLRTLNFGNSGHKNKLLLKRLDGRNANTSTLDQVMIYLLFQLLSTNILSRFNLIKIF